MNVIDILNDRGIRYQEAGKDYLIKCINPEHDDSHPSLRVDKISGIFNCFSCGHKGSIFIEFGADPNVVDIKIAELQTKIRKLARSESLMLPSDMVLFKQDYRDISKEVYIDAGAFQSNEEEEFKNRVVFPLYDIRNNLKVFIGRALHSEEVDRYLFYPKNVVPPLFPAHPKVIKSSLIIVEGIFDALNLIDKGCTNVVCAFGTHTLLKTYKARLSHYQILGVNKFYIMFDGDKSGNVAAAKLQDVLNNNGMNAETIELPEGIDPGDLTEQDVKILMKGLYGNET
jgi:DNA primase